MKSKKKIILFLLFLLTVAITAIIVVFFFKPIKKTLDTKTVNVFGAPSKQAVVQFPSNKPEFSVVIGHIKPETLHQQSISITKLDKKDAPLFSRPFYADGFRGNELTYDISSNSASFVQRGSLGSMKCGNSVCIFPWHNFYAWDAKENNFLLENDAHIADFKKLQQTYEDMDTKGCKNIGQDIIDNQKDLSFSDLYKKYPALQSYCSKEQGITPANLMYFLQIEKAIQKIVEGENISSSEISEIEIPL